MAYVLEVFTSDTTLVKFDMNPIGRQLTYSTHSEQYERVILCGHSLPYYTCGAVASTFSHSDTVCPRVSQEPSMFCLDVASFVLSGLEGPEAGRASERVPL